MAFFLSFLLVMGQGFWKVTGRAWMLLVWKESNRANLLCLRLLLRAGCWEKKRQRYGQRGLHCVQNAVKPGSPRCGQWGIAQNSLLSTPGCDSRFMADKIRGEGMFCDSCSKLHPLYILLQNSWRLYVIRKGLADSSVHGPCCRRSRDASASPFTIYDVPSTEESSAVSSLSPTTALPTAY